MTRTVYVDNLAIVKNWTQNQFASKSPNPSYCALPPIWKQILNLKILNKIWNNWISEYTTQRYRLYYYIQTAILLLCTHQPHRCINGYSGDSCEIDNRKGNQLNGDTDKDKDISDKDNTAVVTEEEGDSNVILLGAIPPIVVIVLLTVGTIVFYLYRRNKKNVKKQGVASGSDRWVEVLTFL